MRDSLLAHIYRPGAIEQLQINGEKQGVEVFSMGDKIKPVNIAKAAIEHATKNEFNIVILDTAGRLHIDDDMMAELQEIKENVTVHQTVLVVDAMTGQDAVNVAKMFDEKVGIDGVILTKLDGDTRGGAALSIRAVTGKPILYVGMGEKLSDLEQFYPDRMASRILGMGDVLTLIEKAQADIDEEQAKRIEQKMRKNEFDFEMYLESMSQMKKMGGLSSILGMMPGLGMGKGKMPEIDQEAAEKNMARTEAIIYSMTPEERRNPSLMNPSRKNRIARGAGVDIAEVNRLVQLLLGGQREAGGDDGQCICAHLLGAPAHADGLGGGDAAGACVNGDTALDLVDDGSQDFFLLLKREGVSLAVGTQREHAVDAACQQALDLLTQSLMVDGLLGVIVHGGDHRRDNASDVAGLHSLFSFSLTWSPDTPYGRRQR